MTWPRPPGPRQLQAVAPEDHQRGSGGHAKIYGWGWRYAARIADVHVDTVRAWFRRGMPLWDPVELVAWALARRGYELLADQLLEVLEYAPRWADPSTSENRHGPLAPGASGRILADKKETRP